LFILFTFSLRYTPFPLTLQLDPDQLAHALLQPVFLIYTLLTILLVILLSLLSRSPRWGGRYIGIDVGVCALYGGYTVLSTKALASLLSTIFLDAFRLRISWGLVAVLVGTSVCQIKYLNRALMRFQSKVSCGVMDGLTRDVEWLLNG
jgi:hypothetical protein